MKSFLDRINLFNPHVRYVNFLHGDSQTYSVPWRIIYDFEIIYVTQGELVVSEIDKNYVLRKGDFHLMPPNIRHRRYVAKNKTVQYYNVHLDLFANFHNDEINVESLYIEPCNLKLKEAITIEKFVSKVPFERNIDIIKKTKIKDEAKIISIFEELYEIYSSEHIAKQIKLKSIILDIFFLILTQNDLSLEDQHKNAIEKYLLQLFENSEDNKIKSKYVSKYGFSPQYFRKLFKAEYNISPHKYLIEERLSNAKKLLKETSLPIKEISMIIGYENPYYFSRIFKKYIGISPKGYRNQ